MRLPATTLERAQRKQDLLLASGLVRTQLVGAVDDLGRRADATALRFLQLKAWVTDHRVWLVTTAVASIVALAARPHVRSLRLLHWSLLGWRVLRVTASMLGGRRPVP